MQKDVKTNKIDALRLQKLRRRIISKGAKAIAVHALGFPDQIINELRHSGSTAPSHDVGRDFVCNVEGENSRMTSTAIDGSTDGFSGGGSVLRRIQKANLFIPGNINQDLQFVL